MQKVKSEHGSRPEARRNPYHLSKHIPASLVSAVGLAICAIANEKTGSRAHVKHAVESRKTFLA